MVHAMHLMTVIKKRGIPFNSFSSMFFLILFYNFGWCQEADSLQSPSPGQRKLYFIPLPALSYNPAFGI